MQVGVVIPFYQREPGILPRALRSVFEQRLPDDVRVRIVIVDDGSPLDPAADLQTLSVPDTMELVLLRQQNGGPAAARNAALDYVHDVNVVAFLDSDDEWASDHLAVALSCFRTLPCDLYFDDSMEDEQSLFATQAFDPIERDAVSIQDSQVATVRTFKQGEAVHSIASNYISHTSSIVFRNIEATRHLRFDLDQKTAGEDHLMWIRLALASRDVCFSSQIGSRRGSGVNLFRGVRYHHRIAWFKRHGFAALKYRKLLREPNLSERTKKNLRRNLDAHGGEMTRALLRPSIVELLSDRNCRAILAKTFPYPWTQFPRHIGKLAAAKAALITSRYSRNGGKATTR